MKLLEIILYHSMFKSKLKNFYLLDYKRNIILLYSDIMLYKSSLERNGSAIYISLSTLLIKKLFLH
jgi:hypothetical protein